MKIVHIAKATVLLLSFHHISPTEAWCNGNVFVRKCKVAAATALIVASQNVLPVQAAEESITQPSPPATLSSTELQQKLGTTLQAPTADTPQIKLPQNFQPAVNESLTPS